MSDYRRLVSYIYSYPGGTRDKNVGFAKAEVRNGQFQLNISLKGVYTDAPESFGVHLLVDEKNDRKGSFTLLHIGNIIVNGGAGKYTDLMNPENINQTGYLFDDVCGIAVARQDNRYYMMFSLWKDTQINPELVTFAPKDSKKQQSQPVRLEENRKIGDIEAGAETKEEEKEAKENIAEAARQTVSGKEQQSGQQGAAEKLGQTQAVRVQTASENAEPEEILAEEEHRTEQVQREMVGRAEVRVSAVPVQETANPQKPLPPNDGISGIFENADFINAFDDDYYFDCIEVTPSQLQNLPLEDKAVVNNSFLEHGYYNFRHLLFGRVKPNERHTSYFIGVPGMYCNRERFMATMFGFNNFKKSHRADYSNPYFGYWYQEI